MAEGAQTAETVCFSFTATGLRAAADGWETRLYEFMAEHELQCKITRIDLAHDFLNLPAWKSKKKPNTYQLSMF